MSAADTREPRAFAPDDPAIVEEPPVIDEAAAGHGGRCARQRQARSPAPPWRT